MILDDLKVKLIKENNESIIVMYNEEDEELFIANSNGKSIINQFSAQRINEFIELFKYEENKDEIEIQEKLDSIEVKMYLIKDNNDGTDIINKSDYLILELKKVEHNDQIFYYHAKSNRKLDWNYKVICELKSEELNNINGVLASIIKCSNEINNLVNTKSNLYSKLQELYKNIHKNTNS